MRARGWDGSAFRRSAIAGFGAERVTMGRHMGDIHIIVAWVLPGVVGLHFPGALYHRFVLKGSLLQACLRGWGASDRAGDFLPVHQ